MSQADSSLSKNQLPQPLLESNRDYPHVQKTEASMAAAGVPEFDDFGLPIRKFVSTVDDDDKGESDAILNYLYHVYESNVDIQVRFRWTPGTSALWDNR